MEIKLATFLTGTLLFVTLYEVSTIRFVKTTEVVKGLDA